MPKRKPKIEPPYKARLDALDRLIHPFKPSAREPRPERDSEEIGRLGEELYADYPNEPGVLRVCLRHVPSIGQAAYKKFVELMMTPENADSIPYAIQGLEQYYEDAWGKFTEFLGAYPEYSAPLLALIAHEIKELAERAMGLLIERIPQLSHPDLINFVYGVVGINHAVVIVNQLQDCDPHIKKAMSVAASRLLDERVPEVTGPHVLPNLFLMEDIRERVADFILSCPFVNWKHCERIVKAVSSRRKQAWEFALKHKAVSFPVWFELARNFEYGMVSVETTPGGTRGMSVKLSATEWEDMWSVGERLAVKDEELVSVATNIENLAVKAAEKLAIQKKLQALALVVSKSGSQDARVVAARNLLDAGPTEEMLVSIVVSGVPSLRREAARKLASLPVVQS